MMLIKIHFGDYLEMLFIQISKEILKEQRFVNVVEKDLNMMLIQENHQRIAVIVLEKYIENKKQKVNKEGVKFVNFAYFFE